MKRCIKSKLILILFIAILLSGCWNYREINELSIVAGIAIDKDSADSKYQITAEIVSFSLIGKEVTTNSKTLETDGDTIFDAVRNMIKISPKRLYWGHSLVFIVSEQVAREGIVNILDWVARDQETRSEAVILITKGNSAKEILLDTRENENPICFDIYKSLTSQKSLAKAQKTEIYQFINTLSSEGVSSTLPVISTLNSGSKKKYNISGTAIFKQDKLIGFIDGEETQYFLYVINNIKGGLLLVKDDIKEKPSYITLEILKSETKVKPSFHDEALVMQVNIKIQAAIAELSSHENFLNEAGLTKIKDDAEKTLENDIKKIVNKVQTDFDADIFGFGQILRRNTPQVWKSVSSSWDEEFKNLEVKVHVDVKIKNSAFTSKPIRIGD